MTLLGQSRRPRQRPLGPSDSRSPTRRRRHGLSPGEQDALRRVQGNRCAICLRSGLRLVIDHDHRHCPGREGCRRCVRGMLCPVCNSALGWLGGDANIDRVLTYLSGNP